MQQNHLITEFEKADAILKGHFVLSSGLHSDTYLQCARVLMEADRAAKLCSTLAEKVRNAIGDVVIDMVVAPAMGGVIVGYEMGRQLGVASIFCERSEGVFTFRRGFAIKPEQKILVVEDVVTTGKSSLEAFDCIKKHGGEIVAEACLIDRRDSNSSPFPVPLIPLIELDIKTYTEENLPEELAAIPVEKPGSRWLR